MNNVSVIIPTWNREQTLGKAIQSALEQTHPPLEVLVCGVEGTPDKKVVESIDDSRVRWVEVNHTGLPATPRNRGIRVSRGEWLAFLDSDDEWLPEKLEKQFEHINKTRCNAVCSDAIRYVPSQGHIGTIVNGDVSGDLLSFPLLIHINYVICSSVLIKKDIVEKCNGFPEDRELRALEDYAMWLRASTFTDFAFIKEPLLIYRDEPKTSVRAFSSTIWDQRVNVLKSFISWANNFEGDSNSKEYLDMAKRLLLRTQAEKILHTQAENVNYYLKAMNSKIKSWIKK